MSIQPCIHFPGPKRCDIEKIMLKCLQAKGRWEMGEEEETAIFVKNMLRWLFCFLEDDAPDIICVGNTKPKVHKQS